jgi:hypothetical protein
MANAVAEGARETGAKVDIKRVPELVPQAGQRAGGQFLRFWCHRYGRTVNALVAGLSYGRRPAR